VAQAWLWAAEARATEARVVMRVVVVSVVAVKMAVGTVVAVAVS
jgi:hypothetical protein